LEVDAMGLAILIIATVVGVLVVANPPAYPMDRRAPLRERRDELADHGRSADGIGR
jgi:hypothetical protein